MTADGSYSGVVDRFEGDRAVLLLEADGETVAERVVDSERLPEDGRHVDAVLDVQIRDGEIVGVAYDPEQTASRADRAQRRFDELSRRPPSANEDAESDTE
ncbi:DUF3006 domain-containing protein [Halobacterium rubrum]|uniref:DUF3006 domain-containing protein n=1 Tax=Halobacterium TaxID=2239 RepID=UPI001F253E32|nr:MULTISPECIES: DUF3006 domain-containing protein [Halobacterium]MDH5021401.1 DUF3006 domain-containing protein [Halobacterium rubrum]